MIQYYVMVYVYIYTRVLAWLLIDSVCFSPSQKRDCYSYVVK